MSTNILNRSGVQHQKLKIEKILRDVNYELKLLELDNHNKATMLEFHAKEKAVLESRFQNLLHDNEEMKQYSKRLVEKIRKMKAELVAMKQELE